MGKILSYLGERGRLQGDVSKEGKTAEGNRDKRKRGKIGGKSTNPRKIKAKRQQKKEAT